VGLGRLGNVVKGEMVEGCVGEGTSSMMMMVMMVVVVE